MKEGGSPKGGLGTTEGLEEDEHNSEEGSGEFLDDEGSGDTDSEGSGGDGE